MSEESNQDARPQEVKDLQKAIEDVHSYKNVVALGVFPGRNANEVSRLSSFLNETYKQLEAKFMEHPYIQDLIAKSKAEQAEQAQQAQAAVVSEDAST